MPLSQAFSGFNFRQSEIVQVAQSQWQIFVQFVNTQKSDILLYLYHKEGKNTEKNKKKEFFKSA